MQTFPHQLEVFSPKIYPQGKRLFFKVHGIICSKSRSFSATYFFLSKSEPASKVSCYFLAFYKIKLKNPGLINKNIKALL